MNGAMALPCTNTNNNPTKRRIITIGKSQYFFLPLRNLTKLSNVSSLFIPLEVAAAQSES